MSAPDRPTREQVDGAMAMCGTPVSGDHLATFYAYTLAAEVRALRAELADMRQRDEAQLAVMSHSADTVAELERSVRDLEAAHAKRREDARELARAWTLARIDGGNGALSAFSRGFPGLVRILDRYVRADQTPYAPLPAVPDGEDGPDLLGALQRSLEGAKRKRTTDAGEDVPARLDAAAAALNALVPHSCAGGDLGRIAVALRLMPADVRAAVAAALARPTEREQ